MSEKNDNLIKTTCKQLGLTYKQLGELIGLSEGRVKQIAILDNSEISEQVIKSLEMLIKIRELETEINEVREFKILLKRLAK
nr:XRE family transcriptional regulator [uncultured Campylobacter sp.]